MRKRDELTNPNSCMSKAKDDEMTFVLLGRDVAAPDTIRFWVAERIRLGKNTATDSQILEAIECAEYMDASTHTWDENSGGGFSEPPQCVKCGLTCYKGMPRCKVR